MTRKIHGIMKEPIGDEYRELLAYSLKKTCYMLLVTRSSSEMSDFGKQMVSRMHRYIESSQQSDEWFGTKLYGGELAFLNHYTYNQEVFEIVCSCSNSLYDWRQPLVPEDICLIREDKNLWLVTISHESDSYFYASDREIEDLVANLPFLSIDKSS
jgi:hypothetical protein